MFLIFKPNDLKQTDIIFFVICVLVVVLSVSLYFLMPLFKHKEYEERRKNLRQREEAFYASKRASLQSAEENAEDLASTEAEENNN